MVSKTFDLKKTFWSLKLNNVFPFFELFLDVLRGLVESFGCVFLKKYVQHTKDILYLI
jgi:hypothetical protein